MFVLRENEKFIVENSNMNFFNVPTRSVFNDGEDYEEVKKALEKVKVELILKKEDGKISIVKAKAETIIDK